MLTFGIGVDHAQTVRADQRNAGLADLVAELRPPAPRPRGPISLKPAEITTIALTPLAIAWSTTLSIAAEAGTISTARSTGLGMSASAGIGVDAENRLGLGIDRVHRTVELGIQQIAKDIVADGAGPGGSPDHGDRLRDRKWRPVWMRQGGMFQHEQFSSNFLLRVRRRSENP